MKIEILNTSLVRSVFVADMLFEHGGFPPRAAICIAWTNHQPRLYFVNDTANAPDALKNANYARVVWNRVYLHPMFDTLSILRKDRVDRLSAAISHLLPRLAARLETDYNIDCVKLVYTLNSIAEHAIVTSTGDGGTNETKITIPLESASGVALN